MSSRTGVGRIISDGAIVSHLSTRPRSVTVDTSLSPPSSCPLLSARINVEFDQILRNMESDDDDDDMLLDNGGFNKALSNSSKKRPLPPDRLEELHQQRQDQQPTSHLNSAGKRSRQILETPRSEITPPLPFDSTEPAPELKTTNSTTVANESKRVVTRKNSQQDKSSRNPTGNLPKLSKPLTYEQQKETILKGDTNLPEDQALQRILFKANFRFMLHKHQFLAVRRVAGVPDNFPLHKGSKVKVKSGSFSFMTASLKDALHGLDLDVNKMPTKGLCIADSMGLGKTVEAIAGAVLCNEISLARGEKKLPILIVSPNDAVQIQWRDTLLLNGIPMKKIIWFKKGMKQGFDTNNFVLMTRHAAAAEIRAVFDNLRRKKVKSPNARSQSPLFPHASIQTLGWLHDEYLADKGKTTKTKREKGESRDDTVTGLISGCRHSIERSNLKFTFRMVITDEAHFLKNRVTFWTYACALSAVHAWRSVPLTGTPYNNGISDLATIMTLIDPKKFPATTAWWKNRLSSRTSAEEIEQCTLDWHRDHMLRRGKETIAHLLPKKQTIQKLVCVTQNEIDVYVQYEVKLVALLNEFSKALNDAANPIVQQRLKNLFQILMAYMSCMRSSLIHPLLPSHGREVTKLFSPSRCSLAQEKCPQACVCCNQGLRPSIRLQVPADEDKKKKASKSNTEPRPRVPTADIDNMEEGEDYDDDMDEEEYVIDDRPLVPIPRGMCCGATQHLAHEKCLDELSLSYAASNGITCPRCLDLRARVGNPINNHKQKFWCKGVVDSFPQGFSGSEKLNSLIEWAKSIPKGDKMLIVSFFKGSLDLVEAILVHELGWDCARFDGDVSPSDKNSELDRFKRRENCRVLLMTVQSGGVGLNITEGNHIAFLDRWFNPFVHDQAEDRCHRLGQKKDVSICYFDVAATVDEVMFQINKVKQENSEVLLSGGSKAGRDTRGLTYKELSGLVSDLVTAVQQHRAEFLTGVRTDEQIPPFFSMESRVQMHQEERTRKRMMNEEKGEKTSEMGKPEERRKSRVSGEEDCLADAPYYGTDGKYKENCDCKPADKPDLVKSEKDDDDCKPGLVKSEKDDGDCKPAHNPDLVKSEKDDDDCKPAHNPDLVKSEKSDARCKPEPVKSEFKSFSS